MKLSMFGLGLLLSTASLADTWTVDDDNKADFSTIQDAVDAASNGDEIIVYQGTYTGNGTEVVNTLGKEIWLHGVDGVDVTIIDATGLNGSAIVCATNETPKTIISGFTLTGGTGTIHPNWGTPLGGGLFAYFSSPTISDCIVTGNEADFAGGMWIQESQSTIENVQFDNNQATYPVDGGAGGLYLWDSVALVTGCTFENNSCTGAGAALRCKTSVNGNGGTSTIRNCTFTSNHAQRLGGAVATYRASPTFEQCSFNDNTAKTYAGAVNVGGILATNSVMVTFLNCSFNNNTAGIRGGALQVTQAAAIIEKCSFSSNSAVLYGGGIAVVGVDGSATCSISGSIFQNNDGGFFGGAIYHLDVATSDIDTTMFCGNQPNPINGTWNDLGGNTMNASCKYLCMGDIDASGDVTVSDILTLIADFGQCNGINSCFSDLNDDEQVNVMDLLILIGNWGVCQ